MAFYGIAFLLWEASTPFVDMHHILKALKLDVALPRLDDSARDARRRIVCLIVLDRLFRTNAVMGYCVFTGARLVFGWPLCWSAIKFVSDPASAVPWVHAWFIYLAAPTMCCMNLVWWVSATRQLLAPYLDT